MGGIGKTQIAISYAKHHSGSFSSTFWLNATSEASLKKSLRRVAGRIIPPETASKLEDDQICEYASNWFSEQDNSRWLLIFDNYDEPEQYEIDKYYPAVMHGSIIVTTRQPESVTGERVRIRSMDKTKDSVRILALRTGRENVESGKNILQNSACA